METTPESDQTLSAPGDAFNLWGVPIRSFSEAPVLYLTLDEATTMLPTEGH